MSFNWRNYFKLAVKLEEEESLEGACLRTSVSRSYYSIFNCVLEYVRSNENFNCPDNGTKHIRLQNFCKNQPNPHFKIIGNKLASLRKDRNKCDYDEKINNIKKKVKFVTKQTEKSFNILDNNLS